MVGAKFVVHNYGHGGAGITMALGCAHEVRDIVSAKIAESQVPLEQTSVAILGAGVMGLTAATLLREMRLKVTIYAQSFTNTTSDRAGGQWAPSVVEYGHTPADKVKFERILCRAFRGYEKLISQGVYGVSRRPNYTWVETASFKNVPTSLIPAPTPLTQLPFAGHTEGGFVYQTLLVEPPIFLNKLRGDLMGNVKTRHETFVSPDQISELDEPIIINCLGFGSRRVFGDNKLVPIKGQLIRLKAQPALQYLYSGAPQGYIFPRHDKVVVGGTEESCNEDDTPDPVMCAKIIEGHKEAFAGRLTFARVHELPDWLAKYK
jgi:glycine/D-amino acid oxidase-like deaminating enzyme